MLAKAVLAQGQCSDWARAASSRSCTPSGVKETETALGAAAESFETRQETSMGLHGAAAITIKAWSSRWSPQGRSACCTSLPGGPTGLSQLRAWCAIVQGTSTEQLVPAVNALSVAQYLS